MKPLLVAVDFSPLSLRAIEHAVEFAEHAGRRIDLIHVTQATLPAQAAARAPAELLEQVRHQEDAHAHAELERLHQAVPEGLRGQKLLRRGPPAETICEAAAEGYGLVVVSTRGRTGLSQLLIGSVAERVVRLAPTPVLVVR